MAAYRIYASEIAALAGMNPYEPQDVALEKFRERVDTDNFEHEVRERGEEPEWLQAKKLRLDPRFKRKIEEASKPSINTAELSSKKAKIEKEIKSSAATEKHKKLIRQEIKKSANTSFGVHHEKSVIEKWSEETGKAVLENVECDRKEIFQFGNHHFILTGRVDGIVPEEKDAVLEIKNRAYKLFHKVREYEMVQVQAYCFLRDCEKAYLVEALKTDTAFEIDWQEISKDIELWENVVEEVKKALSKHFSSV